MIEVSPIDINREEVQRNDPFATQDWKSSFTLMETGFGYIRVVVFKIIIRGKMIRKFSILQHKLIVKFVLISRHKLSTVT